jgi:hypothetical protein
MPFSFLSWGRRFACPPGSPFFPKFFASPDHLFFIIERQRSGDAPLVARTQQRIVGRLMV